MAEGRFCPRCGAALPAGAHYCPSCGAPRRTYLIWVPIAVIALGLLGWAVLTGMPFGREPRRPAMPEMDVITEGRAPAQTVARIGEDVQPAPPLVEPEKPLHEISEAEAMRSLRAYILSRHDYGTSDRCLALSSLGYRNAGYGFQAFDRCAERSLGRWRVDSEDATGIFLQRPDGRYLRP